ncbi:MAG: diol dehydratase small subunit [Acidobacteria bacterium]|nr:diol dehydratase small subunit [Acidobacteriota bacterium]
MIPEYPIAERQPQRLKTPSGLLYGEITLERVLDGKVRAEDLRISGVVLELQAQIAINAGRPQLAENLRRAAELVDVPEEEILKIYNALRPGRAGPSELETLAAALERNYGARRCAGLLREAAAAYTRAASCP